MRNHYLLATLLLALAAPAFTQQNWASADEYDLYQRIQTERVPALQVQFLEQWETTYPNSDYKPQRLAFFISAYKGAGRPADAFSRAAQLVKLEPKGLNGQYALVALAPSLQDPSPEQIRTTEETANDLLARAAEIGRAAREAALPTVLPDTTPQTTTDPETERLLAFLRQWRSGKRPRTPPDAEGEVRKAAEAALAWVRRVSK